MEIKAEELINAIRWRLGIPADADPGRAEEICRKLFSSADPGDRELVKRLCRFLADAVERAVRQKLQLTTTGISSVEERAFLESLWNAFQSWYQADAANR